MKTLIMLALLSVLFVSCVLDETITVEFAKKPTINQATTSNFSLASVQLINNQFILTGTNLNDVTTVKIKEGVTETTLAIESKNATQIVANTLSNVSLAAEKVFDFIISDASAAATFSVDFTMCNTVIAGKGFDCTITPVDKDILAYDNITGKWAPIAPNWTVATADVYRLTGKVGIGTATPSASLDVVKAGVGALNVSGVGSNESMYVASIANSGSGQTGTLSVTNASTGLARSIQTVASGAGNIGYALQAVNNSASGWGIYTSGTSPNYFASKLGIGVLAPVEKLEIAGNVKATAIIFSSDKNFKKNISPLKNSVEKILGLQGVQYNWKREEYPEKNFDDGLHLGFIAQDVAKIFPNLVKGEEGNLAVDYVGLIAPMVEVMKYQDKKLQTLEEEVQKLKAANFKQMALLESLAAKVEKMDKK